MSLMERPEGFTCVKEANLFIIAERESARFVWMRVGKLPSHGYEMFSMWVSLDRGDPRFEAT